MRFLNGSMLACIPPFRLHEMKVLFIYLSVCLVGIGCAVVAPDRLSGTHPDYWSKLKNGEFK